jgi:hypothetical protein
MNGNGREGGADMKAVKVQAWVENDGELHLTNLPCKKWDRVEVIVLIPDQPMEEERQEALRRLQSLADESGFKSSGPYPTRDELHERH